MTHAQHLFDLKRSDLALVPYDIKFRMTGPSLKILNRCNVHALARRVHLGTKPSITHGALKKICKLLKLGNHGGSERLMRRIRVHLLLQ